MQRVESLNDVSRLAASWQGLILRLPTSRRKRIKLFLYGVPDLRNFLGSTGMPTKSENSLASNSRPAESIYARDKRFQPPPPATNFSVSCKWLEE